MRHEVKVAVYDRMTDPGFKWTKQVMRNDDGGRCAVGVVIDLAVGEGITEWSWLNVSPTAVHWPAVLTWAGLTQWHAQAITMFNDHADSAADVAEFIKNLPDTP